MALLKHPCSSPKNYTTDRVNSPASSVEYAAGQGGGLTSVILYITSINVSPSNGRFRAASSYNMHPADLSKTQELGDMTKYNLKSTKFILFSALLKTDCSNVISLQIYNVRDTNSYMQPKIQKQGNNVCNKRQDLQQSKKYTVSLVNI